MQRLAGAALEAVDGDHRERDREDRPRRGHALGRRREREGRRERGRERQQVELVGAGEQIAETDDEQRRERPRARRAGPPPQRPRRPDRGGEHEEQREQQLEQLVRVGAHVPVRDERQPLQALIAREPEDLAGHVAARDDRERRQQHRRDDREREQRLRRAGLEDRARERRHTDLGAEHERQAREHPAARRRPAGGEQRPQREQQRRRRRARPGRERHRAGDRDPRGERPALPRVAPHEAVGGQRGEGIDRDAQHAPGHQRRAERLRQRGEQHRLARGVVRPEVAVGPLAVGHPPGPREHEALVVRAVAAQQRETRQRGRGGEQERLEAGGRRPRAARGYGCHTRPAGRRADRRRGAAPRLASACATTARIPWRK